MVIIKPGKHQRSKQRCQPGFLLEGPRPAVHNLLFWAHILCLSYLIKAFLLVSSSVSRKQLLCFFAWSRPKKENKNIQQRTLSSFKTFPLNHVCLNLPAVLLSIFSLVSHVIPQFSIFLCSSDLLFWHCTPLPDGMTCLLLKTQIMESV